DSAPWRMSSSFCPLWKLYGLFPLYRQQSRAPAGGIGGYWGETPGAGMTSMEVGLGSESVGFAAPVFSDLPCGVTRSSDPCPLFSNDDERSRFEVRSTVWLSAGATACSASRDQTTPNTPTIASSSTTGIAQGMCRSQVVSGTSDGGTQTRLPLPAVSSPL